MMNRLLKLNAEFAKNVWLELSTMRLIAMPAILGLILLVLLSNNHDDTRVMYENVHNAALAGFVVIGLLWGMKNAADSIINEHNENTWDWQKMSALGALKLVIGKLLGSTIYNWYGALLCWVVFMLTAGYTNTYNYDTNEYTTNILHDYKLGFLLIISMISLTGVMQLIALQRMRKTSDRAKMKNGQIFIVGFMFMSFASSYFTASGYRSTSDFNTWYGIPVDMTILSSVFYCGWIVAGLYRSMRRELLFTDVPTWWLAFILSSALFQYGYVLGNGKLGDNATGLTLCLGFTCAQLLFYVYMLASSEPKSIVNTRVLLASIKTKNYRSLFENLPLWVVTLPIAFVFGLLATIVFQFVNIDDVVNPDGFSSPYYLNDLAKVSSSVLLLISVFAFVLRDLGVLLLLNFSQYNKRADVGFVIYLVLAYGLFPALLGFANGLSGMFYPTITEDTFFMLIFPLGELVLVLFLLRKQWFTINKALV
jgi:hypothetical protein